MASNETVSDRATKLPQPRIGQVVDLGCETEQGRRWFRSRIEDLKDDTGLLAVGWPMDQLRLLPLHPGEVVRLGVSANDALFAMEMRVEGAAEADPPQLLLSPAGTWERVQRRNDVRHPVSIRPSVADRLTPDGWQAVRAVITNISGGGLQLRSIDRLSHGDRLEVVFELPDGGSPLRMRLDVRRVQQYQQGERTLWEVGCQFRDAKPGDRDRIVRFIFAEQRAIARRQRGL